MTPTGLMTTPGQVSESPSIVARDDPNARHLLQRAQGMLQKWPEGFCGFRATIRCRTTGRDVHGSIRVTPPNAVEVDLPEPEMHRFVQRTLAEIIEARTPRFFKDGDGRFPVTFEAADGSSRRVVVHRDGETVAYRLDAAGRIAEEARVAEGAHVVTVIEEYARAMPGRVLPARSVTAHSDVSQATLLGTDVVHDCHVRIDHVWLPLTRCITITSLDETRTILLELGQHALV